MNSQNLTFPRLFKSICLGNGDTSVYHNSSFLFFRKLLINLKRKGNNMSNKRIISVAALLLISAAAIAVFSFPSIPGMFRLNKQLQENGYYTAEFEFKMLGIVYNLDRGRYLTALTQLKKLERQMRTREGFIKVPEFSSKEAEMEFYLNLQNPETGAFMDSSYPLCTFTGPTGNVLNHLDMLVRQTGRPLKLKYPLRYLDIIDTREKLNKYLDDAATVGWIGSRFPQTSFHFTRCLLSMFHENDVVEKYGLYRTDPSLKSWLLDWFYKNQDPETGLWGPRSKSGELIKKDTQNTASILKAFIDEEGNDLHRDFPLRYRDRLAVSLLEKCDEPLPADDAFDRWHEWKLDNAKTIKMMIRLWNGLSDGTKSKAVGLMKHYIKVRYQKFYVRNEGAFSYYPNGGHATLDGSSGEIGFYKDLGAFSGSKLIRLWGKPEKYCADLGNRYVTEIEKIPFDEVPGFTGINSVRLYANNPENGYYTADVLGVFYPGENTMLDVMEFIPKIRSWVNSTGQSMGNWTSREDIQQSLSEIKIKTVPVLEGKQPFDRLNIALKKYKQLVLVGFDELQKPVCRITFHLK